MNRWEFGHRSTRGNDLGFNYYINSEGDSVQCRRIFGQRVASVFGINESLPSGGRMSVWKAKAGRAEKKEQRDTSGNLSVTVK